MILYITQAKNFGSSSPILSSYYYDMPLQFQQYNLFRFRLVVVNASLLRFWFRIPGSV